MSLELNMLTVDVIVILVNTACSIDTCLGNQPVNLASYSLIRNLFLVQVESQLLYAKYYQFI